MFQAIQIAGALLILIAFGLSQARRMDQHGFAYLALNAVGSITLTILAAMEFQYGFILLEGVWALVSIWGLFALTSKKQLAQ
ncbi:MAG: hypothetical protein QM703_13000 [Gemmatales bacterium]